MVSQDTPKVTFQVADYLLDSRKSGLKMEDGIMSGRRVRYFKGSDAYSSILMADAVHDAFPKAITKEESEAVLQTLLDYGLIVKCHKKENHLVMATEHNFMQDGHYIWIYDGSQLGVILGATGLVSLILVLIMFPLWPAFIRDGTWYISILVIGFLALLMVTALIRLLFYILTYIIYKPGIWILPNLFEDVGFIESFLPLWCWDTKVNKKEQHSTSIKRKVKEETLKEEDEELSEEAVTRIIELLAPSLADLNMTLEELLEYIDEDTIIEKLENNANKMYLNPVSTSFLSNHEEYITEDDGDENYIDEDSHSDENDVKGHYENRYTQNKGQPRKYTGLNDVDE